MSRRARGGMFCALIFGLASLSSAQGSDKRPVTPEAHDKWRRIEVAKFTPDGQWAIYVVRSGSDMGELVIRSTEGTQEFRVRGVAAAIETNGEHESEVIPVQTTADSRFVLFSLGSSAQKRTPLLAGGAHSASTIGLLSLPDGGRKDIPGVTNAAWPQDSGKYLGWMTANSPLAASSVGTLVVRELATGAEFYIEDVKSYVFDRRGHYLAYIVDSNAPHRSGVFVRSLQDGRVTPLFLGGGEFHSLTFDRAGRQIAFFSIRDEHGESTGAHILYHAVAPFEPAKAIVESSMTQGLRLDVPRGVQFVETGDALLFYVSTYGPPKQLDTGNASNGARFELWHWKDPRRPVSPTSSDTHESHLTIYHLSTGRLVQLANTSIPDVKLSLNGRYAVGIRPVPLQFEDRRGEMVKELYSIDVTSRRAHLIRQIRPWTLSKPFGEVVAFSSTGRYVVYFEDRRWWSVDLRTQKVSDLTGRLLPSTRFDSATFRFPEGLAGWSEGNEHILVYSRQDIWELDPSGHVPPRNLTSQIGQGIVLRLWSDYDWALSHYPYQVHSVSTISSQNEHLRSAMDPTQPQLLIGLDTSKMASSIWRTHLSLSAPPERLLSLDKRIMPISKAGQPQHLVRVETFEEFPDLWAGKRFDQLRKISNANPQQVEYRWGTAELVHFDTDFGASLSGVLYKPEDFDSSKKYPMIVHIYERQWSTALHRYYPPQLGTFGETPYPSLLDYISRGYLVFQPDIHPAVPYPGPAAVAAVRAGVQAVLDRGYVDLVRLALAGQSYGGYETAYILTKTTLFRCAVEGAGITNFVSAYGTPTGVAMFEISQGRQGRSLWHDPFAYLANSPLIYANHVRTPLLIRHNKLDGAVPFSQGMEFFQALSRNHREAYLFNYHGERHILDIDANRSDWAKRVQEFIDHFLVDAPLPDWMK